MVWKKVIVVIVMVDVVVMVKVEVISCLQFSDSVELEKLK